MVHENYDNQYAVITLGIPHGTRKHFSQFLLVLVSNDRVQNHVTSDMRCCMTTKIVGQQLITGFSFWRFSADISSANGNKQKLELGMIIGLSFCISFHLNLKA